MPDNRNLRGALLMALAMAGFALNDAMVRLVAGHMNTGEIMLLRGAMTTLIIALFAWRTKPPVSIAMLRDRALLARTICEALAAIAYVHALSLMPLSNAASIMQALPLVVTMGAALFLGEKVGWRRWLAITAGFSGVLVIIRPAGDGFSAASLIVIGSVLTAAARDLATKRIMPGAPTLLVSGAASVAVTISGALLVEPMGGWRPPAVADLMALTFGAMMLFTAYQTLIMAMRTGDISFIAPFRYTSLLWSILLGVVFLGEQLDMWIIAGSGIVVVAGVYMFYRENQLRRLTVATIEPVS
ncbi:drug/metabolite transporter (DMT)-like permease [Rhizobium sp. SG_E_25_P2]|uniref:DMT family transporter n=1 Tax=Rhizobium sp. SG_E_25_P2 TaxID=2879942 RepID=UPI002475C7DD|nr:DMT family transporter [Rhizobium sp. SG_E_25_P2]MDH6267205.1 drug/metabolite transporter (DMT)-like permease [Rhizobium sp. SG_E_25_P2]